MAGHGGGTPYFGTPQMSDAKLQDKGKIIIVKRYLEKYSKEPISDAMHCVLLCFI